MPIPENIDQDKLAQTALALLALTSHDHGMGPRIWKNLDWDVMDLLHERGWIGNPRSKARSVVLTEEGQQLAEVFLSKHFGRS